MANVDRPSGLTPVRHLNGMPWNGKARMYYVPVGNATALYVGDAVVSTGSSDSTGKYAGIVAYVSGGGNIRGVVIGFSDQPYLAADTGDLYRNYLPISTEKYALVVDDPDVIFEIQEDNVGSDLDADDVGICADIAVSAGDTANGKSGMELDSSTADATTAAQLKILGVSNKEDNALGTHCKWDVLIVEHELRSSTGVA